MKNNKKVRIPRKLKKQIPNGVYYYELIFKDKKNPDGFIDAGYRVYPFFFFNHLDTGDCKYIYQLTGLFNGEEDIDLALHDQCKSCYINMPKWYN